VRDAAAAVCLVENCWSGAVQRTLDEPRLMYLPRVVAKDARSSGQRMTLTYDRLRLYITKWRISTAWASNRDHRSESIYAFIQTLSSPVHWLTLWRLLLP